MKESFEKMVENYHLSRTQQMEKRVVNGKCIDSHLMVLTGGIRQYGIRTESPITPLPDYDLFQNILIEVLLTKRLIFSDELYFDIFKQKVNRSPSIVKLSYYTSG